MHGFSDFTLGLATPFPRVCLAEPPIGLTAGGPLSFDVQNPFNATCEAVLAYSDPNFLPTSFVFEPTTCSGVQVAQLIVPPEAPNGNATVSFRCEGQPSEACNHAVISKGLNRSESITNVHNGVSGCVEPVLVVTTLLETMTSGSTAAIQTLISSVQTSTTRFPGSMPTSESSPRNLASPSGTTQELRSTTNSVFPAPTTSSLTPDEPLTSTESHSWADPAFTPVQRTSTSTQTTASSKGGPNFTDGITIPISSANSTLRPLSMTILTSLSTVTLVSTLTSLTSGMCDPTTTNTKCGL
ncbi:hypothetical protein J7T55_011987 [Diaporthe amygdali]|uniref:uncharacterized protein n=1 Tax=Phomopsis amygdali TaxID=1214568 RepID=UPI0022FE3266|nr:uncharacterized protein J7T55_011987 [Diaporthe amygdali]KAJ0123522.1 hypothetical protein J7T55_011987 [Diaporthe amygdali]